MPTPTINPWALAIGTSVALLLAFALLYWQRWQRRRRRERPPVEANLLRPPGHSLATRVQEKEESLSMPVAVLAVCGGALAVGWAALGPILFSEAVQQWRAEHGGWLAFLHIPLLPGTLTCGLATLGFVGGLVYGLGQTARIVREIRGLRLGLRGEQAVAEKLAELAPDGYRALHDFPAGKDWNIDHIVVGPGGVFAIETKTRSKRQAPAGRKEHEVLYDGKALAFPWFTDRK